MFNNKTNDIKNGLVSNLLAFFVFFIFSNVAISRETDNLSLNFINGDSPTYKINLVNKLEPLKTLVKEKTLLQHPFSRVLSTGDLVNYSELLNIVRSKSKVSKVQWQKFEEVKRRIKNPVLFGIIEYEKLFHPTAYKASYEELKYWLSKHKDFPEASKVYRLAKSKYNRIITPLSSITNKNRYNNSNQISYYQNKEKNKKSFYSNTLLSNTSNIKIRYPVSIKSQHNELVTLKSITEKHILAKFVTNNKPKKALGKSSLSGLKTFVLNSSDIVTSFSSRDLILSKNLSYTSKRYRKVERLLAVEKSREAFRYYLKYIKGRKLYLKEIAIIRARMIEGLTLNSEFSYTIKVFKDAKKAELTIYPEMYWWAGLSYYALKDYKNSALIFRKHAQLKYISAAQQARSWYWSAFSFAKEMKTQEVKQSLKYAALSPSITLYGFLANIMLHGDSGINWDPLWPNIALIKNKDALSRVLALIEVGLYKKADTHLSYIINKDMSEDELAALSSFAEFSNLPMSSYRAASFLFIYHKIYYTRAMYPIPFWNDKLLASSHVDPLLTIAVTRQESAFKYDAVSRSGALGLMQLMPLTASYVSGKTNTRSFRKNLFGINTNIELGSKYLNYILTDDSFNDSIIHAIASYNAGPHRTKRQKIINNNSLFFLELIPIRETRDYVNFVLTNYLVYRDRIDITKDEVLSDLLLGVFPTHIRGLYYTERTITNYLVKNN